MDELAWDDLDLALARDEHLRGMAYGVTKSHCPTCATVCRDRFDAELRAACVHDSIIEITAMQDRWPQGICERCGTRFVQIVGEEWRRRDG